MNVTSIQKLLDGPRNHYAKVVVALDSGDITIDNPLVCFDPKQNYVDRLAPTNSAAIDELQFSIEDGLLIYLWWDAATPVLIAPLAGRGKLPVDIVYNNAGTGTSGKILLTTQSAAVGTTLTAFLILNLHKTVI